MGTIREILRWLLAGLMVLISVLHFTHTAILVPVVPAYLPAPEALVYISGIFEILGGIGLVIPALSRAAAWGASMLGYRPEDDDIPELYIELNRAALRKYPNAINDWAGTLFHEFLHRIGLSHPTGYTGSLIREAEGCFKSKWQ